MSETQVPSEENLLAQLDKLLHAPVPVPALAPAPAPDAGARRPRVLCVDDHKDYRAVLARLLGANGYDVREAGEGEEGLRLVQAEAPDLILLEYGLPGMNGYEFIQALRSRDETRKVPVILLTGVPVEDHLKQITLDVAACLRKPASNAQVLAALKEAAAALGLAPVPAAGEGAEVPEIEAPEALEPWTEGEDLLVNIEKASSEDGDDLRLDGIKDDSPLIARVNQILVRAVDIGASDIHIEPQESGVSVRVRVNGSLQPLCVLPAAVLTRLSARVKIMAELVITERRRPQDGQFRATIRGKKVEFRVSILPTTLGEKIVLRVLGGSKLKEGAGELGMDARDQRCVDRALATPHGLILATGPTGSGKTTTLYSMLASVNKPDVNILTAEDPVEYRLAGISQVHVKPAVGLTFEAALRSFLRQDPDVMLVGEIRDLETAEIAVKASITGHLVLSTLHTNSCSATVTRLTHMGLSPFLVAASVKLIVAQRLVKELCPRCKVEAPPPAPGGLLSEAELGRLGRAFRAVGCADCGQSGYKGRTPLFEVMPVGSAEMRRLILAGASVDELCAQAVKEGMTTLREAALAAVREGTTSLSEGMKIMIAGE